MSTTIDSLQIEITQDSQQAVNGLDALTASLGRLKAASRGGVGLTVVTNQLKKLNEAVNTMQNPSTKISQLVSALKPLESIGKSNLNSTINSLKKLPEITKQLAAIDMDAFATQINRVVIALKPLADEMNKVAAGFSAFPSRIQRLITQNEKLSASNAKTGKSFGIMGTGISSLQAKFGIYYLAFRRLSSVIADWVTESNAYVENLNLFTVSMGKHADEALKYAEKVQDAMGIDMSEWIRNQGIFMQIATGFGVVEDKAYQMSRGLTQISYDISSFFNIPIEDALEKVQSGISGELEPLRRLGYALDVATLQQIAYNNGITQNINKMTQAQKSQLRYIAIMQQSKNVMGDMARTLITPANALRILNQQLVQLKRALGNMIIPLLITIIPYVQAFVRVLTEAANMIANLFGFELPKIDYSGLEGLKSGAEAAEGAVGNTTDAVKKLQSATAGFDELNIISQDNNGSTGAGAGVGGGYDLPLDLSQYDYDFLGEADTKVKEIADKIKKHLAPLKPFFKGLVDILKPFLRTLKDFYDNYLYPWLIKIGDWMEKHPGVLEALGKGLGIIAIALTGYKALKWLGDVTGVSKLVSWLWKLVAGSDAVTGAFQKKNKSLDEQTTKTGLELEKVLGLAGAFGLLLGGIQKLKEWLDKNPVKLPDWKIPVPTGIPDVVAAFDTLKSAVSDKMGELSTGLVVAFETMVAWAVTKTTEMSTSVQSNWDALKSSVSVKLGELTSSVQTAFEAMKALAIGKATELSTNVQTAWNTLKANVVSRATELSFSTQAAFESIKQWVVTKTTEMSTNVQTLVTQLRTNYENIVKTLSTNVSTAFETIKTNMITLTSEAFNTVKTNFVEFFNTTSSNLYKWATNFGENVRIVAKNLIDVLNEGFRVSYENAANWIQAMSKGFVAFGENICANIAKATKSFVDTFVDGLKSAWDNFVGFMEGIGESISNWWSANKSWVVPVGITLAVVGTVAAVALSGGTLAPLAPVALAALANGGIPDEGQLFVAREAGAELVGGFGSRTGVMNNDQIVDAVSQGVYEAVVAAMPKSNEQPLEVKVYLDGKEITKKVEKIQRERGTTLLPGGVAVGW